MSEELQFPKGFLWGASTASHQIEGHTNNNWSEWEKANAERLAKEAPDKYAHWLPSWQEIKDQATDPKNYISGRNSDHYHLYEQDFDLAKQMGLNTYRFSIEWSRVEPTEGQFDQKELKHYHDIIAALKKRGIKPIICLWHWTVPMWFYERGDWQRLTAVEPFRTYAERMAQEFGNEVDTWLTLNEPDVYTGNSYLSGTWPPQMHSPLMAWRVLHNLIRAHKAAYHAIKKHAPQAKVSIAKHNVYFEANGPLGRLVKARLDWWWNFYFLNKVRRELDFIGLNHYFHHSIKDRFGLKKDVLPRNRPVSDLGWDLYPYGIYRCLKDLKRFNKPIIITENGLADAKDQHRSWYIEEVLRQVHRAIAEGVDVQGYLHWSLLDNFEWSEGFWPRFGLIEVDYKTLKRRIRPSGLQYAEIIKHNAIEE